MNSKRKSSRRDFLQGKAAIDALGDIADGIDGPITPLSAAQSPTSRSAARKHLLTEVGRKAMACQFQIFAPSHDDPDVIEAALQALDCVDLWEDRLSVYREQSEISRINRVADLQPCVVEADTLDLLDRCIELWQSTGGAFDITAAPLVRAWGFHIRQGRFPSDEELQHAMEHVGSNHLVLDRAHRSVRFRKPGVELNLGSIGKGFALDRCREVLDSANVTDYMIHGGHSSILARGNRLPDGEQPGWWVTLRNPLRPAQVLAELRLCDSALGTSGSGRQFFYHHGRRYGHVIDPRTGYPAESVLSTTVLGPAAEQADALATAFFVMGIEATRDYCRDHPELAVVFVRPSTRGSTVALELIQLEESDIVLSPSAQASRGE